MKRQNLSEARDLYLMSGDGISDQELADRLAISRATAYRYRQEIGCRSVSHGRYVLEVTDQDIREAENQRKRIDTLFELWENQKR